MPPHAFGEKPLLRAPLHGMHGFTPGTDLITLNEEPAAKIVARPLPASASKFLPRSGRRQIRDTLTALMEHMRTEVEQDGIELIVDVVDEQAEQQLWRKDDAAWYWLAAGGPNTLHSSEHDVLRMHNATLRRIVDPTSMGIVEEQMELSKLPPDPEQHVPLDRWVASRPKEDIVWEYLQSTMRATYRLPSNADVPADRMRMELNSVTLYMYLVTMNPSAYGTHVRTLMRGAYQYALHHLLAARQLTRSADEYVKTFVGLAHQPLLSGVLASSDVGRSLEALIEASVDNRSEAHSETSAAKQALVDALANTAFIKTVRSLLEQNTVRIDDRDPNFAYVFGLYKTLALIRAMCKWVALASHEATPKHASIVKYADVVRNVDRVDSELRRELSSVGHDEGAPLGEVSQSFTTKLLRRVRAAAELYTKLCEYSSVSGKSYSERVYLVRLLAEALYSAGMYYARLRFAARMCTAARGGHLGAASKAKFAIAYKEGLEGLADAKRRLANHNQTITRLIAGSTPTKTDIDDIFTSMSRIWQIGAYERFQLGYVGTLPPALTELRSSYPLMPTADAWKKAAEALLDWRDEALERADRLGYDGRRGSARIDLSRFGESRFGAHDESRTESTIRFINIFFLTGLYQTLDTLDGQVVRVIFDTGRDEEGQLVTTHKRARRNSRFGGPAQAAWARERLETRAPPRLDRDGAVYADYKRKVSELRSEVVFLLEILRNGAYHGTATGQSGDEHRTQQQQAHLVRNACTALTHVLKRVLSRSPVGLVFAICSHPKSLTDGGQQLPIGATSNFEKDDINMLTEVSTQSRDLADAIVRPSAVKLHSFASRSQPVVVPDFNPQNTKYVWNKP
jgi:hypothetical protein